MGIKKLNMKKIFFVLSLIVGAIESDAQDTLFVSKCSDIEWASNFRNSDEFVYIQFEDGSILKVGDKIITKSGLHGKISELAETTVVVETMSGKLKMERSAISLELSTALNKKA